MVGPHVVELARLCQKAVEQFVLFNLEPSDLVGHVGVVPAHGLDVALGVGVVARGHRRLGDQRAQAGIVRGVGQVGELLGGDPELFAQLHQPPGDLAQAPLDR